MLRAFSRRLALKIIVPLLVGVGLGFLVVATISARMQARSVERLQNESARATAATLAAGVRSSMLTGNGIAVRALLDDAKANIDTAKVRVFAADGTEVFGEKAPAPPKESLPPLVRDAVGGKKEGASPDGLHAFAVENEARCRSCHADGELRGILTLATRDARTPIDGGDPSLAAISRIARAAFVQIMTARHHDMLEDYFAELEKQTPGVVGAAVFSADASQYFGRTKIEVPGDGVDRAVEKPGPAFTVAGKDGSRRYHVMPLANEPRCQGCHDPKPRMRGAMVVAFDPSRLAGERTLFETSRVSLQHVMLSGLGRMVTGMLDEVRASGTVTELSLYDAAGRVYYDPFATPTPPRTVAEALAFGRPVSTPATPEHPEVVLALPLANEPRCQSCHGPDRPLRGVLEVRVDARRAAAEIRNLKLQSLAAAICTIAVLTAIIVFFLTRFVLSPVGAIGEVAERVGEGRFDAKVDVRSEDEVGRLGQRINEMINGLRQKLELAKFVSKETLKKVESHDGEVGRGGVRRRITVLFSDVRGFTSFSETREPEAVVEMLNHYLQVQAEVVVKYHGDIDKFVGDELMARFVGPDQELRATQCAVECIRAVAAVADHAPIAVGVGVNVGEVVLGAVGAADRMDFTVIGDAVNLGARLCSAAQPGEVIVSAAVRDAVGESGQLVFEALEPIQVKGKKEPIQVFRVSGAGENDGRPPT